MKKETFAVRRKKQKRALYFKFLEVRGKFAKLMHDHEYSAEEIRLTLRISVGQVYHDLRKYKDYDTKSLTTKE